MKNISLKVTNLSLSKKFNPLISNLSFSFKSGDKVGIIGEEGNGKTSLLNAIYNNQSEVFYNGSIGYIEQNIDKWNDVTILEYLTCNDPNNLGYEYTDLLSNYYTNAPLYGLDDSFLDKTCKIVDISGGEKLKLQLLKTFTYNYDIILLDEPTNDLDLTMIALIEKYINEFEGIVLFVSHDLMLLRNCANKILHLEIVNRKSTPISTMFDGCYEDYLTTRQEEHDKMTHQARNEQKDYIKHKVKLNDMYNRATSALKAVPRSAPSKGRLLKKTVKRTKKMVEHNENKVRTKVNTLESDINISFVNNKMNDRKIYELIDYDLKVGNRVLIKGINLTILGGSKTVVVGANGCGKTTLMKKICQDMANENIFYMPQQYSEVLDDNQTPFEFIRSNVSVEYSDDEVNNVLTSMRLDYDEINTKSGDLSEGQKAKTIISLLALNSYDLVLIDELSRNISPLSLEVIIKLFQNYDGTVFAISHDKYFVENVFNKIIKIENCQLLTVDKI